MANQVITLIADWRNSWKFASVQFSVVGMVLMGILEFLNQTMGSLPYSLQEKIPHSSSISLVLFALVIVGRLFKLTRKTPDGSEQL